MRAYSFLRSEPQASAANQNRPNKEEEIRASGMQTTRHDPDGVRAGTPRGRGARLRPRSRISHVDGFSDGDGRGVRDHFAQRGMRVHGGHHIFQRRFQVHREVQFRNELGRFRPDDVRA